MANTKDLNPDLNAKINQLVDAVKAQGGSPTITSGYRTKEEQTALYNSGNGGVPVAKPGTSKHESGMAADIAGDKKTTQLLHSLAPQFGLSFPLADDPVHVQLAGASQGGGTPASGASTEPLPLVQRLTFMSDLLGLPATKMIDTPDTSIVGTPDTALVSNEAVQTDATATDPAATTTDTGSTPATGDFADLFNQAGQKYGISPALLSAVAKQESGYNPNAKSSSGAIGLMQMMPGTAKGLGINPSDPTQAVDGAARLLSGYLEDYNGDVPKALAAYNAGPGAVKQYGGVPPYKETQNYVKNITGGLK